AAGALPDGPGGVEVRLLCAPRALSSGRVRVLARALPRCELRVAGRDAPHEAVIVDGRIAYVTLGPGAGRRASAVEDPATVRALDLMFTGAWAGAVAPSRYPRLGGRVCVEDARRILESLRTGRTDEAGAREMQVSLRTYRRYVAEIMRELGAHSRFQAGVRAVEAGLLPGRH
ncbi:hypothetical protein RKE29_28780, partial [Streptomyces sp. B1866]|nr:hypothetical protein [Streptomyces sp. B1866]